MSAKDVLDRAEQLRIAEVLGYAGVETLRPVEQFMRDYFEHTGKVRYLVSRFVASVRPRAAFVQAFIPLFTHQVEGDYRVGPREISGNQAGPGEA